MKRPLGAVVLLMLSGLTWAAERGVELQEANIDLTNDASLQRGARLFVNYCMGCHSASYMRYNRLAQDLGLTEAQVEANLIFDDKKVGETMTIALDAEMAEEWFGTAPPDLSVIARARGVDWLYTYLKSFYLDESGSMGVNNLVFPRVGMPHVLWRLQGWQRPVYRTEVDEHGREHEVIDHLELVEEGTRTPAEYDRDVRDLVAFLAYVGEPAQLDRRRLGVWVLLFLALMFVVFYALKKDYWKDVH
ncbi:MAG: cytochrome c1 [Gammaproteobacteria bacterium]|nr:cytochrome c1 [Gammaproteobacteria bacterium]NIR82241.1 cytochrome c1 [Gammaproteobacteria bacterium]NIR91059.1 cytochrome c1 [Gammaproteobacteria bacterium]NIU03390.1 cytochrome c1 [Gammaproteobacteria bacterium]NIV50883.1 cytochrome c1 [Gammaproteobacteria bacterium]